MEEQVERVVVSYDAALAPMCGGVAAALLFCYFEKCFREASYPASGIRRQNLKAWRTGLGYTAPQPWFRHFYKIGVLHGGAQIYRAAVRAQREFYSPELGAYVFYAMELKHWCGDATLHRNGLLIERQMERVYGNALPIVTGSEHRGAYATARQDAKQFDKALSRGGYRG